MSVINKMLQDLDKRNQRAGNEAQPGGVVKAVQAATRGPLRTVLLGIGALVAVAVSAGSWLQDGGLAVVKQGAAPAPVAAPVAMVATVAPPPAVAPTPAPKASNPPVPPPAAVVPTAVAPAALEPLAAMPPVADAAPVLPKPSAKANATEAPAPAAQPLVTAVEAVAPRMRNAKTYSQTQVSGNLVGEAVVLDRQGRVNEAKALLDRALKANPQNLDARQMLIQLHIDTGRLDEARALLVEGLHQTPERTGLSLTMARLQLEGGDAAAALKTLQAGLPGAGEEPQFHATLAALQLRLQRYDEAVKHYIVALRSDPAFTPWLVGVGLALEGLGKRAEATEAYRRADSAGHGTTPELARFLDERLAQLAARAR